MESLNDLKMKIFHNKNIQRYLLGVVAVLFFCSCKTAEKKYYEVTGLAQGTYYRVVYEDSKIRKDEFDFILKKFDTTFSVYIQESVISRINNNDSSVVVNEQFKHFLEQSKRISEMTDGLFDITVGPLVKAWRFGPEVTGDNLPSQGQLDSILNFVGINKIWLEGDKCVKADPRVQITGNANAQGFSTDLIAFYLDSLGVENYLVDVGSEMRTKGVNSRGVKWTIGITRPEEGIDSLPVEMQSEIAIVLDNKSLATSGNYRKFFYAHGQKYAHTVNPITGQSIPTDLLSITVVADECIDADAIATACMAMGVEKSKEFFRKHPEFDALMIFAVGDSLATYKTDGIVVR
ncbi:MAG: FAD:protein FMN transferase [Bacteroidales bacterium]|nr:FAD:protein FMN transferase [Bacteroidales bacterium]